MKRYELRTYIPEKKQKGRRHWQGKGEQQKVLYQNRKRVRQESTAAAGRVPALFEQWRVEWEKKPSKEGQVFPLHSDKPVDLHNLIGRVIRPHVEGERYKVKGTAVECIRCEKVPEGTRHNWETMYAGRRRAATLSISPSGGNYQLAPEAAAACEFENDSGYRRQALAGLQLPPFGVFSQLRA